jgi:microcystin-dependent protein
MAGGLPVVNVVLSGGTVVDAWDGGASVFSVEGTQTDTGSAGSHNHTVSGTTSGTSGSHTHDVDLPAFTGSSGNAGSTTDTSGAATSGSAGTGGAHNNMPPYMLINWVMRV